MHAVRLSFALAATLLLAACSGAPTPVNTVNAAPVDHTVQATIDGEWIVTRTVVTSDDTANPGNAVGTVSTRNVLFGDLACDDGPCEGGVLSGLTTSVRDSTSFTSSGNTLRYEYSGFVNCLRQDTGTVLLANGFSYTSVVELTMETTDAADDSKAATLTGTMTYTDALTDEAIEAGCAREPRTTTTTYTLAAVRAASAAPTPAP